MIKKSKKSQNKSKEKLLIYQKLPDEKTMYEAMLRKDTHFEGVFFVCVKTTGIFCRPSCTARKPKHENVEFYSSAKEALGHGYRPCKVCHPMELAGETPGWLKKLLSEIDEDLSGKFNDSSLRKKGIDPARIRRWFNRHHGVTFQAYLRALRINRAYGRIRHKEKVIDTAYEAGYESLSGFAEAFKKKAGFSPKESSSKNIISITKILTPIGPMFAGAVEEGICLLEFTDRRMLETEFTRLKKYFNSDIVPGKNRHFNVLNKQLEEYFAGKRKKFSIPLVMRGTDFQLKVWRGLQGIPCGETRSYEEQAISIGNPKAVRAVAQANGDNMISILIPCHRVIAKNGKLAGYGGGLWRKQYLLNLERKNSAYLENFVKS